MLYTISNEKLRVQISDHGAELQSVINLADGCEYIWQGDAKYWGDRAPTLFPICGRFLGGKYSYRGKEYEMGSHGFAAKQDFTVSEQQPDRVTFLLRANEQTRAQYPFEFELFITFSLCDTVLHVDAVIKNADDKLLHATFGAHPGFNVPFTKGHRFDEYTLTFGKVCSPNQMEITPEGFFGGHCRALPLVDGTTLPLCHEQFKIDGIFMSRTARRVTLGAPTDAHGVTLDFEDFPYLGVWQEYGEDTPFLCLEPWCGLPSYPDLPDDLEEKNDMFRIAPNAEKSLRYSVTFY